MIFVSTFKDEPLKMVIANKSITVSPDEIRPLLRNRERSNSGTIFDRRLDFSNFNVLPRYKINSYHIKMEDDSSHGNDDIRNFILSSLSTHRLNRIQCILCQEFIQVYDKYPLIDGTFFISPRQHSSNGSSVPVTLKSPIVSSTSLLNYGDSCSDKNDRNCSKNNEKNGCKKNGRSRNGERGNIKYRNNKNHDKNANGKKIIDEQDNITNKQYLNAVCMSCLEGWTFRIECRFCHQTWNGSSLTLGSMYTYDIFAATPCCLKRLSCTACEKPVISPDRRLEYFSDYSQRIPCGSCGHRDHHFVKPLGITFTRSM